MKLDVPSNGSKFSSHVFVGSSSVVPSLADSSSLVPPELLSRDDRSSVTFPMLTPFRSCGGMLGRSVRVPNPLKQASKKTRPSKSIHSRIRWLAREKVSRTLVETMDFCNNVPGVVLSGCSSVSNGLFSGSCKTITSPLLPSGAGLPISEISNP